MRSCNFLSYWPEGGPVADGRSLSASMPALLRRTTSQLFQIVVQPSQFGESMRAGVPCEMRTVPASKVVATPI